MKGMTTQERYKEISKISGLSEDIVRRVLIAEKESILNSLRRGERATLIGRCVIRPEIRQKIEVGGTIKKYIKVKAEVAKSLEDELMGVEEFAGDEDKEELTNGIRLRQINSLL